MHHYCIFFSYLPFFESCISICLWVTGCTYRKECGCVNVKEMHSVVCRNMCGYVYVLVGCSVACVNV